jgi:hypothetical protein
MNPFSDDRSIPDISITNFPRGEIVTRSPDDLRAEVSKLSPRPGDILLLQFPRTLTPLQRQIVRSFEDSLAVESGCFVVSIADGFSLEVLSDDQFAALGLQRITADTPATVHIEGIGNVIPPQGGTGVIRGK